jgi:hypothetical protein
MINRQKEAFFKRSNCSSNIQHNVYILYSLQYCGKFWSLAPKLEAWMLPPIHGNYVALAKHILGFNYPCVK